MDILHAQCLLATVEEDWGTIIQAIAEKAGLDYREFFEYPLLANDWILIDDWSADETMVTVYPLSGGALCWSSVYRFDIRWSAETGNLPGKIMISFGRDVFPPRLRNSSGNVLDWRGRIIGTVSMKGFYG